MLKKASCFIIMLVIALSSVYSVSANTVRSSIVAEAQKYVDVTNMGSANHHALIDYYNSQLDAHPEYLDSRYCGYANYNTDWCAIFVSVIAMKCNATDVIFPESACWVQPTYMANGTWIENDAYVPSPGDLIFYDWSDSGYGDCTGDSWHVGIVESCDGKTITTIEGNTDIGGSYPVGVHRRYISVDGRYIRGFAVPRYSGNNSGNSTVSDKKWSAPANEFDAYIARKDCGAKIGVSSTNNVEIVDGSNSDTCIWHFKKLSNGNFIIKNKKSGLAMEAGGSDSESWKNAFCSQYRSANKHMQWILLNTNSGVMIKNAGSDVYLDCADNEYWPGVNLTARTRNYNCPQAESFEITIIKVYSQKSATNKPTSSPSPKTSTAAGNKKESKKILDMAKTAKRAAKDIFNKSKKSPFQCV